MSTISGITQPTSIPDYDPSVLRTVTSSLDFPNQLQDLYFDSEFFFAPIINNKLAKAQENLNTLVAYTKVYNTVIPKEKVLTTEYDSSLPNFKLYTGYEIQFDENTIKVYQDGVLYQTITSTDYGNLLDVRDVVLVGDTLYVLDGNFLLILGISSNPFTFTTFIGGLGNNTTQYLFNNPIKIISDTSFNTISVLQSNGYIKTYQNNTFISGRDFTTSLIDLDIIDGSYYALYEDLIQITESDETVTSVLHSTENPVNILVDETQKGFFWLSNETTVDKYTKIGLAVGNYDEFNSLSSFSRCGNLTSSVDGDEICIYLDYSTVDDLIGVEIEFDTESILVDCDELATDLVLNDSLNKLYQNILQVNSSILNSFEVVRDSESGISSINVITNTEISELGIGCNNYFGRDECVSCESWNRVMERFQNLLIKVRNRLFGIDVFPEDGSGVDYTSTDVENLFNNTLGGQSSGHIPPQLFNPSKTPISLTEVCENPSLANLLEAT